MQFRPSRSVIATAAVTLIAAVWLVFQFDPVAAIGNDRAASIDPTADERLTALEAQLAALSTQVDRLAGSTMTGRTSSAARAFAIARAEEVAAIDPRAAEAQRIAHVAQMENAFGAENIDPGWAPVVERRLSEVSLTDAILGIEAAPPKSSRVQCRSSMCRLEFNFANEADATDWSIAYLTGMGSNLRQVQQSMSSLPDGTRTVLMFGTR